MADGSSQIGYIIHGGRLLDLNSKSDVAEDIHTIPSSQDRTVVHNFAKHLQTTAKDSHDNDDDASRCFSVVKKSPKYYLEGISDAIVTSSIGSAAGSGTSTISSYSEATNKSKKNSPTATVTADISKTLPSANIPVITETATQNYEAAFSSDVVVLGKRIVAIEELTCEESHKAATAASRARLYFTDRVTLSVRLNSSVNHSVVVPIPDINDSPIPAQQRDGEPNTESKESGHSDILSFSSPLPFSELRLSDHFQDPPKSQIDSFNSGNSSPSGLLVKVFDASGCFVVPGLLDCHTHVYRYSTPLGIEVDEFCLKRGVTTAVDAGSAGEGFKVL